uniref:Ubiquitin-conjugating enzyme E2 Z n=1 Tax=viral metagenome TaxID=1070528 RepID=A0A6C0JBK1_9ZZZZ
MSFTFAAIRRIKKDVEQIFKDSEEGIMVYWDQKDMGKLHAIIVGPKDTPHEGGFFHISLDFPKTYPFFPPIVKFHTTDGGKISFNNHIFKDGSICLSILNTGGGKDSWAASLTLSGVLVSIRSLLNENYYNESGIGGSKVETQNITTNKLNTFRVAICQALENANTLPGDLGEKILTKALENKQTYYTLLDNISYDNQIKNDYKKRLDKIFR